MVRAGVLRTVGMEASMASDEGGQVRGLPATNSLSPVP